MPLISVCVPAYNRAALLAPLLDSIFGQDFQDMEVVIAEDSSPEQYAIRRVATEYAARYPGKLYYHENPSNLGYDGNLRHLVELACGDYVVFMGNDDLLAEGALAAIAATIRIHPNVGVVLRSYDSFVDDPLRPVQTFRYFGGVRFFPAGAPAIVTFFRRCVFISGMVVRRESAHKHATDRFDGTLLYQQYLVGHILANENGVYLPQTLSHQRLGGTPDFGNSPAERGRFVPREQTPESSVHFTRGMLRIAADLEQTLRLPVYMPILRDIGNYAYPILSIQAGGSRRTLIRYARDLAALGLWRVPLFHVYVFGLLLLGRRNCDSLIAAIKARLGRSPVIGKVYSGQR